MRSERADWDWKRTARDPEETDQERIGLRAAVRSERTPKSATGSSEAPAAGAAISVPLTGRSGAAEGTGITKLENRSGSL